MDPIRNFVSPLEKSDISNGVDRRIIKKSICLVTLWVFLLSQLCYASLYEDILGLPSSQDMPTWKSDSDWINPRIEPLYNPEPLQIEPTLPPPDGEEGDPTGIWGWLREHLIEPVANFLTSESTKSTTKTVLETGVKIIFAPFLLLTACTTSPQVTPTPTPEVPIPVPTPLPLVPTPTPVPAASTPVPEAQIKEWIVDFGTTTDPKVQNSALENLIASDLQAVDLMIKALTDEKQSPEIQTGIVFVFGEMVRRGGLNEINKRKAVVESLIPLLWADSIPLRYHTYYTLKNIGGPQAEEAIRQAQADDNWLLNPALEDLKSLDPKKRAGAAMRLAVTDNPRAVEPLIEALEKETDFNAKLQETYALGKLLDSRAIPVLEKIATSDENKLIRKIAEEALEKIREK